MHRRGEGPQQGLAGEQHRPNSCSSKCTTNKAKEFQACKHILGVLASGVPPGTTQQHVWAHPSLPLQPRGVAQASPPAFRPSHPTPATIACTLKTNGLWAPHWTVRKASSKKEQREARTPTSLALDALLQATRAEHAGMH